MTVSFQGFLEGVATFLAEGEVKPGQAVKLSTSATVAACGVGNEFCGAAVNCRGGHAAVQLRGYTQFSYTGTAPVPGYALLAADGSGGVKTVTTGGRSYLVLDVDTQSAKVGILL